MNSSRNERSQNSKDGTSSIQDGSLEILNGLKSPNDLKSMSIQELKRLADEIRLVLCNLSEKKSVHFASNLGVVELTIALHTAFDFRRDRLVWDVGHQCYPHKILTGRFDRIETIRSRGGLSGYPNPAESEYDLFLTGHAGCSVGTALGLACGDSLLARTRDVDNRVLSGESDATVNEKTDAARGERYSVAVVGDGDS